MRTSQQLTQLHILHGALFASLAIYAVVGVIATQGPAPPSTLRPMDPGVLVPILGGVGAAMLLVVVPLLRRRLMPARVHPTALVEDRVVLGEGPAVWDNAHLRGPSRIGADCIIGEKTYWNPAAPNV